ncbi:hypothetical protein [uncultured Polaribacter sp.]|uniref:hypothetical protein n=1 Tax=uncultured Polaribacter sp. TaxID=174711 RepID=UPI0026087501|nr:hypothetical protein [uncultured Polaribacter sp.]
MTEETLINYLEFLRTECLRHSSDKIVDENQLQLFKLEVDKFKFLFKKSELKPIIKQKVNTIDFDLTPLVRNKWFSFLIFILGNGWSRNHQNEENLAKRLLLLSEKIEHTIIEVKTLA